MNKNIFASTKGPITNTVNEAGGKAYKLSDKEALAQFVTTGCFNDTYYATAEDQTKKILELVAKIDPTFVAKAAIFSRQNNMKDMPAVLCAYLFSIKSPHFSVVFDAVIDNPKMIRNFCQIIRSGILGRKSFGSLGKRKIQEFLLTRKNLFHYVVGNDPSLSDIIKMVHPKPKTKAQEALFKYILGIKDFDFELLPQEVQTYENFRKGLTMKVPNVPFELLTNLTLGKAEWTTIATNAGWHMTRMNLNTFLRHGVFEDKAMVKLIAERLANKELVLKSSCFPYQLLMAYKHVESDLNMPQEIKLALQQALEHATANVPSYDKNVLVFPDVSGSMSSPITGHRKGATTNVRCVDVAALVAATLARRNNAIIMPFDTNVKDVYLNPYDSIMTNAQKLAGFAGGGTNCGIALTVANQRQVQADIIVYISDNESWVNSTGRNWNNKQKESTETMQQWRIFKKRNPNAKMICIDIQPYTTAQALTDPSILNIGGWSDNVFNIINQFVNGNKDAWIKTIENVQL